MCVFTIPNQEKAHKLYRTLQGKAGLTGRRGRHRDPYSGRDGGSRDAGQEGLALLSWLLSVLRQVSSPQMTMIWTSIENTSQGEYMASHWLCRKYVKKDQNVYLWTSQPCGTREASDIKHQTSRNRKNCWPQRLYITNLQMSVKMTAE